MAGGSTAVRDRPPPMYSAGLTARLCTTASIFCASRPSPTERRATIPIGGRSFFAGRAVPGCSDSEPPVGQATSTTPGRHSRLKQASASTQGSPACPSGELTSAAFTQSRPRAASSSHAGSSSAAFNPVFRCHGQRWRMHVPWAYGPEIEAICRRYLDLRYRLMPYTYTLVRESHETGIPLMRMLALVLSGRP